MHLHFLYCWLLVLHLVDYYLHCRIQTIKIVEGGEISPVVHIRGFQLGGLGHVSISALF